MQGFYNMNNENKYIEFRGGNHQEIRQSLANFCKVPIKEINKNNIKFIYKRYKDECYGISDALWTNFHGNFKNNKTSKLRAWHYHKTGSNGEIEWFQEGLLNKSLGIIAYIDKLHRFCGIDLSNFKTKLIRNNDEHHKNIWVNEGPEYGPYSYISRKYAAKSDQYNLPEVIERVLPTDILEFIRHKIKPTIVEFWYDYSTLDTLDKYVRTYCEMFLDESEDYIYSPREPNNIIPFKNIENVKIVRVKRIPLRFKK